MSCSIADSSRVRPIEKDSALNASIKFSDAPCFAEISSSGERYVF
jgi:hypothetical protein